MHAALSGHAALSLLLLALAPICSAADPWPQFRGINRDGLSVEKDALAGLTAAGPTPLWKVNLGTGFTSIAVAGGRVYACGNSNNQDVLHCLAADGGKTLWTYALPAKLDPNMYEGGPNATPTVADGAVYLFTKAGVAVRLDAVSGKEQWKKELAKDLGAAIPQWGFSGSPTVIGDRLYLNLGDHGTGLNAATGAVVWTSSGSAGYATPVPIDAGKRLLIFAGRALVLVEAADGKVVWSQDWPTRYEINTAEPLIADGKVFLSTGYNFGCALFDISGAEPKELWRNKAMRNHFNGCVLLGGHLYGFDESTLKCLAWSTGEEKWAKSGLGKGSLIAADGKLIVLSEKGELVVAPASPAGFTETSRTQVLTGKCWTSPALANGQLYCRNAKGDLVCLRVR